MQARCQQARERALDRRGVSNHRLSTAQLQALRMDDNAHRYVQQQASQYALSARTVYRVLRLAQTIADLAQSDQIGLSHAMQAAFFQMPTHP